MKKNFIVIIILFTFFIILVSFFQDDEYETLEDVEKLFMKNDISYTSKLVEDSYILDIAKEQKLYKVENDHIYVYIVDKSDMENAVYRVSNERLDDHYVVATTDTFIFAYTERNLRNFYQSLYAVIDEIIDSEKS
ncbi:hypothetical protein [Niallia sp. Krafla_26]|uniref:hypothetical protein n=1 Tax=Niallia sp. Krafla_26 TaxID=3064703 RepID=UPI003D1680C2